MSPTEETARLLRRLDKRALVLLPALLVLVVATAAYISNAYLEETRVSIHNNLDTVSRLKSEQIESWLIERRGDVTLYATGAGFVARVQDAIGGDAKALAFVHERLASVSSTYGYRQALAVLPDGRILAGAGSDPPALFHVDESVMQAFARTGLQFRDLHLETVGGRTFPEMGFAAPIYMPGSSTRVIAALYFSVDPTQTLFPTVRSWPSRFVSAESLLVRREGDSVLFLSEPVRRSAGPLEHRVPLHDEDQIASMAARNGPGVYVGHDYVNTQVLAAVRTVPGTSWMLISKIDTEEAYAPLVKIRRLAGFVLLSGLVVWYWVRQERAGLLLSERSAHFERDRMQLRYSSMVRFAHDGILILDRSLNIVEANKPVESIYGYTPAEMHGMPVSLLRPAGEAEHVRALLNSLAIGENRRYEAVHVRKDGSPIDVELSVSVAEDSGERLYIGIVRDVTRARAQARRIERLNRLYATLGDANEAIVRATEPQAMLAEVCRIAIDRAGFAAAFAGRVDPESGWLERIAAPGVPEEISEMLRINERASEAEGRGTGGQALRSRHTEICNDILGTPAMQPWHALAARSGLQSVAAVPLLQSGAAWGLLCFYAREQGYFDAEYVQLLDRLAADLSYALDAHGNELQRREMVGELVEKEATLSAALLATEQGLWDFDVASGTAKVNSVYARMLGHDPATFVESPEKWRERMHPEDREQAAVALQQHLAGVARDYVAEFRMRDAQGRWRWLRSVGQVISRDAQGRGVRMLGTHTDITEAKERELRLRQSEERLRLQFERMPVAFILADAQTLLVQEWNPAAERIFGFRHDEIVGQSPFGRYIPVEQEAYVRSQAQVLRDTGKGGRLLTESQTRDGRRISCRWHFTPVRNAAGELVSIMAMAEDITESVQNQERRRLWSEVMLQAAEGIMICGPDERIVSVNEAFTTITGYAAYEVTGRRPALLKSGRHGVTFYEQMWKALQRAGVWRGEIWNRRKNGDIFPEWLTITAVHDEAGKVRQYVALFSDITERKAAEERIRHMAHYDALTGLPNRVLLMDRLSQAVSAARRRKDRIGVVYMDLDRFKNINDSLGHDAGDELLKMVADRLRTALREGDSVARLSGDEFVLLLSTLRDVDDAGVVAQKMLAVLAEPLHLRGTNIVLSGSAGVAVFPENGEDARELLRNADAALYRAKDHGGGVHEYYSREMNLHALESLALEASLRVAIERDELVLHYQPQVNIASGRIIGLEALVRWKHPQLGLIPPGRFVPLAEERGLIGPLGRWVLRAACAQAAAWRAAGVPGVPVGVNVSSPQFRDPGFPDEVAQILKSFGLQASDIELELTESILMNDADATVERLKALRAMGLGLSVDDFGTGYSSLNYLRHFPVTRLKIDQSFVRDLEEDRNSANIVAGVISLGKSLDMQVIAEGVETLGQYNYLHDHGCDEAQGYLLARPLPVEQLEPLLRAGSIVPAGPRKD
jgi:diguanylate cyclase (GGDEF)-like protein/PAS domain S-box-containing protein